MRLKKKGKAPGLMRGSILHEMVSSRVRHQLDKNCRDPQPQEILAQYQKKHGRLFREEEEMYGDIIGDCGRIYENYVRYYKHDDLKYEYDEAFVATDLTDEIRLNGYIDKVAVDKQGRRWLVDHKFVRSIPSADERFSELQLIIYVWAWNRWNTDKPVDGVLWDYVRAKPPAQPELLKKGGLSRRKNIDTDAFTYRKAIKRHRLKAADYADFLESLEGKDSTFFLRVPLPTPSKKMLDAVITDFRTTAVMIQKMKGIHPRNMSTFNCKTCEYRALCEAELRDHDVKFIMKTHYRVSERPEKEETHAEEEASS